MIAPTSKYVSPVPSASATTDHAQAASVPIEISVSIVAAPWRAFSSAARWNGRPAQRTTGVASANDSHSQPGNWSGGSMSATSGAERSAADDEPHGPGRRVVPKARRRSGAVPDRRDRADQVVELDPCRVEAHAGGLGREVDRRVDAVELVELPLDA